LKKLKMILWGVHFILEVDAIFLKQMLNSPTLPNDTMTRWLHFIQLFDFEVRHVSAEKHRLPDCLSRAKRDENDEPALPLDEMLKDEWCADGIENTINNKEVIKVDNKLK